MAGKTRTHIKATPVLEAVEAPPVVTRTVANEMYATLVEQIVSANKPGKWFRVFKGLPTSSAAGSRVSAIKQYEDMEAVGRREGDTHSVFARYAPQAVLDAEAKAAAKQ